VHWALSLAASLSAGRARPNHGAAGANSRACVVDGRQLYHTCRQENFYAVSNGR
jgi:hypothetical protein